MTIIAAPEGLRDYIKSLIKELDVSLEGATGITGEAIVSAFTICVEQNPALQKCSRQAIKKALLYCADKRILPINNNVIFTPRGTECQCTLGVKGIREMIYRNPKVKRLVGDVVREADECKITSGANPTILHSLDLKGDSPIIGAYAIAEMQEGGNIMRYSSLLDINAAKACSAGSSSAYSPWVKFFPAMALLVPLRKLAKELIVDGESIYDEGDYSDFKERKETLIIEHDIPLSFDGCSD